MAPRRTASPLQARLARDRRDASLSRISRTTATIAVGTVALAGALGLYVSRAFPGHQAASSTTSTAAGQVATPTSPSPTSTCAVGDRRALDIGVDADVGSRATGASSTGTAGVVVVAPSDDRTGADVGTAHVSTGVS